MPSSCKDIREALALCLQNSDCVMVDRNKPSDCLRPPLVDTLPTQCQQLKRGYGACKRGMVDMRKRFRGNNPVSTSVELQAGEGKGQLYAGGAAFPNVKGTDGNEKEPEEKE
ncbi:putative cytochrome c oxidase assembly protein PET191 [Elsinoe fawcettii]|nr:putative cytochrome c oxidase assembly protein PET191 [Elsinoe fawcettii]